MLNIDKFKDYKSFNNSKFNILKVNCKIKYKIDFDAFSRIIIFLCEEHFSKSLLSDENILLLKTQICYHKLMLCSLGI